VSAEWWTKHLIALGTGACWLYVGFQPQSGGRHVRLSRDRVKRRKSEEINRTSDAAADLLNPTIRTASGPIFRISRSKEIESTQHSPRHRCASTSSASQSLQAILGHVTNSTFPSPGVVLPESHEITRPFFSRTRDWQSRSTARNRGATLRDRNRQTV
jgi:hypothetical protein